MVFDTRDQAKSKTRRGTGLRLVYQLRLGHQGRSVGRCGSQEEPHPPAGLATLGRTAQDGHSRKNQPFVIDARSAVKAIKPKHALCRG